MDWAAMSWVLRPPFGRYQRTIQIKTPDTVKAVELTVDAALQ
jgi:hypothetical protein